MNQSSSPFQYPVATTATLIIPEVVIGKVQQHGKWEHKELESVVAQTGLSGSTALNAVQHAMWIMLPTHCNQVVRCLMLY
jgi:hypothetical protein